MDDMHRPGPPPSRSVVPVLRLALCEPEIAQNVGAILRQAACLGLPVELIEPLGFPFDRARLRRSGLDYVDHVAIGRHADLEAFLRARGDFGGRLLLLTTKGDRRLDRVRFRPGDILAVGRESTGAPARLHDEADLALRIPMVAGRRSMNVACALATVLGVALAQLDAFPADSGV